MGVTVGAVIGDRGGTVTWGARAAGAVSAIATGSLGGGATFATGTLAVTVPVELTALRRGNGGEVGGWGVESAAGLLDPGREDTGLGTGGAVASDNEVDRDAVDGAGGRGDLTSLETRTGGAWTETTGAVAIGKDAGAGGGLALVETALDPGNAELGGEAGRVELGGIELEGDTAGTGAIPVPG